MQRNPGDPRAGIDCERGVSEVLGYILLLSLIVSVVGIVSVNGFSTLSDVRSAQQVTNAERAFDVLGDNMADIYESGAPSRATEISLYDASLDTTEQVTLNLTATENASGERVAIDQTVRPIVWRGDSGTELVYAFGAVLRDDGSSGRVVRPPPFRLDPDRTVLPVLVTRTRDDVQVSGSTVRIRASHGSSLSLLADPAPNYDRARLNITTPRAAIWQQYLDRQPETDCSVVTKPDGETVVCDISDRGELYITLTRITVAIE